MLIRAATDQDAKDLAQIHVRSWAETYPGLLPAEEIAAYPYDLRLAQWQGVLARGGTRVVLIDGTGFAQIGPQREARFKPDYPEELYALYLLGTAQGRGLGRALLRAALGPAPQPFTAVVLASNARALGFYTRIGGQQVAQMRGEDGLEDLVLGWPDPGMI